MTPVRWVCALALAAAGGTAAAALSVGDAAPDFTADAARGGKVFRFSLAEARERGPVVLYFYPKAFTSGCTIEARAFAEAMPRFEALGASVVGMSNDDIETLKKFSVEACRDRFPVAADADARVMQRYDAAMRVRPDMAARISYVIGREGRILHVHEGSNPQGHVTATLEAVRRFQQERR